MIPFQVCCHKLNSAPIARIVNHFRSVRVLLLGTKCGSKLVNYLVYFAIYVACCKSERWLNR